MATPILAIELFNKLQYPCRNSISLGCQTLDEKLGGITFQGITEISGEAGCGKTQMCLILSLQIQLDPLYGGRSGSVAYLSCGEGLFPIRRLSQLAMAYEKKTNISNQVFLSNVHIEQCYNADDVKAILKHRVPELCRTSNVKLLVIDSLAGLIRQEYDNRNVHEMKLRTEFIFNLAQQLKLISDIFQICIIVVNQVKASGFDSVNISSEYSGASTTTTVPALGLAWSHCVNCRISLSRDTTHLRYVLPTTTDDDNNSIHDYSAISLEKKNIHNLNNTNYCNVYNDIEASSNKENMSYYDRLLHKRLLLHESIQYHSNNNTTNKAIVVANKVNCDSKNTASSIFEGEACADINNITNSIASNINNINTSTVNKDLEINSKSKRKMKLEFSPCHPNNECYYEITESGIYGII